MARILLAALAALGAAGCVERELVIRSQPPGARLFLDGEEVGLTPAAIPFRHYGTREIRIELEGYRPVRVLREVDAPFYQYPPLDFVTDVVLPFRITDRRELDFVLTPLGETPQEDREEVLRRAEEMRRSVREP
jgi:esterase/lipase superfamily enzyme